MNAKKAKQIRSIISPENEALRRVYRRAKKQYSKTPKNLREPFLEGLNNIFNSDLCKG